MSDPAQNETAPSADEVGDGGANIDQQPVEDAPSEADKNQRKSAEKQADGDFPIMT